MKPEPLITVFTPTYNRAYCLDKCYQSLRRQTNYNFIWLIIDDGSNDNTKQLVDNWRQQTTEFEIQYYYKQNGGMHTAYNEAYKLINTELSINIDSDDYMTDSAIEDIVDFWHDNKRDDVGGIYALDTFENGLIIGKKFPDDLKEFRGWGWKKIYYRGNYGKNKVVKIKGDKKFIGVTEKINKYPPIPVFEGEKYYSLYHKQHYIEGDYTILILNKPVCIVEYLLDGSSKNMYRQYLNNPLGFCDMRKRIMSTSPSFQMRFIEAIHYVAESTIAKNRNFFTESPKKFITLIAWPIGKMLYFYIKWKGR